MKQVHQFACALLLAALLTGCGVDRAERIPAEDPAVSSETQTNIYTEWLPEGMEQVLAETEPLPELAKAIAQQYEIPEEEWSGTKYYYNYVDLNEDGADEIFAVAMGPYTSGSGGDSGLWLIPYAGMAVAQTFTLVRTPIIVSDTMTNGAHELIFQRSGGGGETEYVRLVCIDGVYSNPADAETLKNLDHITGRAILSNDLVADMESGKYHTLEDAGEVA